MVKYINQPGITDEAAHSYQTYLDMNKAHVVMCARAGIIDRDAAVRILKTTKEMAATGDKPTFPIDPALEGLYFNLDKYLIEHAGMDAGGKVHIARSRNDLCCANGAAQLHQRFFYGPKNSG